jgi:hypothetical protein
VKHTVYFQKEFCISGKHSFVEVTSGWSHLGNKFSAKQQQQQHQQQQQQQPMFRLVAWNIILSSNVSFPNLKQFPQKTAFDNSFTTPYFCFEEGDVICARSPTPTPSSKLGKILMKYLDFGWKETNGKNPINVIKKFLLKDPHKQML